MSEEDILRKIMTKNFCELDYNEAKTTYNLPKYDDILTSLICRAFLKVSKQTYSKGRETQKFWWNSPVILTKYGFAYIDKSQNSFFYFWDDQLGRLKNL